jgi:hypothetical protein
VSDSLRFGRNALLRAGSQPTSYPCQLRSDRFIVTEVTKLFSPTNPDAMTVLVGLLH